MRIVPVLLLSVTTAFAQQPAQISVRNAASLVDSSHAGIAVDSLIQVDLNPLPGLLPHLDPGTVSLTVEPLVTGVPVTLPILSVSPSFYGVEAYLPANLPLGKARAVLSFNGQQSAPASVNLVASSFGLFPSLAQNILPDGTIQHNQLTYPAHPGQYVTLWGTGLGPARANAVRVLVGGKPFPVEYAGPAPGLKGVDQINFQVPDDPTVPQGCYVALQIDVGAGPYFDFLSNATTLSTSANGGACQHPLGFTADQLAQIDAGRSVPAATINVYALAGPPGGAHPVPGVYTRMESAYAEEFGFSSSSLPLFTEPLLADDAYFACSATNNSFAGSILSVVGPVTDLGNPLILSSGSKTLKLLPQNPNFPIVYQAIIPSPSPTPTPDALPPPFFTAGQWQVSASGSDAVKPFQGSVLFPPQIRATNFASLTTIDRQKDQTIAWDPAGYGDSDIAMITLSGTQSVTQGSTTTTLNESVTCRARATDGHVTIPSSLLAGFAPSTSGNPLAFAQLSVAPRSRQAAIFPISLTNGSTIPALIRYTFSEDWFITFQ